MVEICAESSRQAGEPIAATAPQQDAYLLLEYREQWQPKAAKPGNNTLTNAVSEHLHAEIRASGRSVKPLFIRQQGRTSGALTAFVALVTEQDPVVYRLDLASYDDLLTVPLKEMLRAERTAGHLQTEPIYAVCTHKERDRACGKYGWSVYQALHDHAAGRVWQSTHLGGHRFAGTLLALPSGALYGHLDPDDVPALAQAEENGRLFLPRLRGRVCYRKPEQAAAIALHQHTQADQWDVFRWSHTEQPQENQWHIRFDAMGEQYLMDVKLEKFGTPVYTSTGDTEPSDIEIHTAQVIAD